MCGIDYLGTGGNNGKTGLWDAEDRRSIAWIPGGAAAAAFDPAGHHLALASLAQTVCIWDVAGPDPTMVLELRGHLDTVNAVCYSPGGKLIATGSDDHSVRFWDAGTGLQLSQIDLDTQVKALCVRPQWPLSFHRQRQHELLSTRRPDDPVIT